jgi:hypothetical protein
MFQAAAKLAESQAATLRESALKEMNHLLGQPTSRQRMLPCPFLRRS